MYVWRGWRRRNRWTAGGSARDVGEFVGWNREKEREKEDMG